jgi:hypothetical protein
VDPLHTAAAYEFYVKVAMRAAEIDSAGIDAIYLEADLEMSSASLPALSLGANQVVYHDETRAPHQIRVVHGWEESSEGNAPLTPEQATLPANGATVALRELTALHWSPAPGGDAMSDYRVQVSARPDMLVPVSPNLDRITFSPEPGWALPQGWLVPGTRYYWRVRARNERGLWSEWSHIWTFETS